MSEEAKVPQRPVERAVHAWNNSMFGWVVNTLVGVALVVLAAKLFVWAVTL